MTQQKTRITFLALDSGFGARVLVTRRRTKFSTTFRTCGTKFSTSLPTLERYPIPNAITMLITGYLSTSLCIPGYGRVHGRTQVQLIVIREVRIGSTSTTVLQL